jgi:hypothetical protein
MEENHKILMLKKLLSTLLFDKYDIDFEVFDMTKDGYSYPPEYIMLGITVKLDPEKVIMAGDNYDSSIGNILFTFNNKINNMLSYIGLNAGNVRITYEFVNDEEFSDKIKQKVLNVLPSIYDKIPDLPKINKIFVHPKSKSMPHFEIIIEFDVDGDNASYYNEYSLETKNIEYEVSDELHRSLPELNDVYINFTYI